MISAADDTDKAEDGQAPHKAPANRDDWLKRIASVGEAAGYFEPLGAHHWALFADDGRVLYVTFESADAIRARDDGLPHGYETAQENGWSHLCLIAEGETWYRDADVYRYFDRLVDDAFFEDFDRVIFHGAGMGGYAACAFSVTAPGCHGASRCSRSPPSTRVLPDGTDAICRPAASTSPTATALPPT